MLLDHGTLILAEERGLPLETRAEWSALALSAPVPVAECIRVGHAIYVRDEPGRRWPAAEGSRAFAALPLIVSGRPLGALALSFSQAAGVRRRRARPARGARDAERRGGGARAALRARARGRADAPGVAAAAGAARHPGARPRRAAARRHAGARRRRRLLRRVHALATVRWGLAIGDVCGKGVDAAALTALARHTMRAAAHEGHPPGAVLRALNRAVLAETRPGEFLTAIFARVEASPRWRLRVRARLRRPSRAGPAGPRRGDQAARLLGHADRGRR